ncbi:MAG: glycosyltransferase family protein [Propionibacteriaceae bacterium]
MNPSPAPRRVALYSHDTQGLGHIRRNIALAATLVAEDDTDVLLITGSPAASSLPLPPRTDLVVLPAAAKDADGTYHSRSLALPVCHLLQIRSEVIKATVHSFAPDLLVVDKVPLGLKGELRATLTALRTSPTQVVLGLREVLDDPVVTRQEWLRDESTVAIERYYDAVWVYGDPHVFDPAVAYGWPRQVTDKITYTGYLASGRFRVAEPEVAPDNAAANTTDAAPRTPALPEPGYVLGQVGGGQDGHALAEAFIEAVPASARPGVLLTGPFMAESQRQRLVHRAAAAGVTMIDFHPDPAALIADAAGVISMAGYNSVCELLAAGTPTLLVPRVRPRAEQLVRADNLAARHLMDRLHPDDLSPAVLADWIATLPAAGGIWVPSEGPHERASIDLDGLSRIAGLARGLTGRITHAA